MLSDDNIKRIVAQILEGSELFLVDLVVNPGNRIHVFIDGDHDVSVADCRELSVKIESMLNRDTEDFELMVSSAGIDRPLKFSRQFKKNIGRMLTVVTAGGEVLKGKILRADDQKIEIGHVVLKGPKKNKETENTILEYSDIKTAKIEVSFK